MVDFISFKPIFIYIYKKLAAVLVDATNKIKFQMNICKTA